METKRSKITEENRQEAARLKALWDDGRKHRTQAEFGEHYGLGGQANVGHYLLGRSALNAVAAMAFATELGVGVDEFSPRIAAELGKVSGAAAIPPPAPVDVPTSLREQPPEGYVRLPVMAEASAGPGRVAQLEAVQRVDVLESYIRQKLNANPRKLMLLTARGGSMTGLIEDGDIMFVEPTEEFTDDGIYILTLDELIRVKRLSVAISTGNLLIESNDGRRAEELPLREARDRLHIQGRVVGAWSMRSFA